MRAARPRRRRTVKRREHNVVKRVQQQQERRERVLRGLLEVEGGGRTAEGLGSMSRVKWKGVGSVVYIWEKEWEVDNIFPLGDAIVQCELQNEARILRKDLSIDREKGSLSFETNHEIFAKICRLSCLLIEKGEF
jgi:hypothetical protein